MASIRANATLPVVTPVLEPLLAGAMGLHAFGPIRRPQDQALQQAVKCVVMDSKLDAFSGQFRLYDETLTQSARDYAFPQATKWKQRFLNSEPVLH